MRVTSHVWLYGRGTAYPDGPLKVLHRENGRVWLEGQARAVKECFTTASESEAWLHCAKAMRKEGGRLVESAERIEARYTAKSDG